MAYFQERERKLAVLKEEKVELPYRRYTVSDAVSKKQEYYEGLLKKQKEGVNKIVNSGWLEGKEGDGEVGEETS